MARQEFSFEENGCVMNRYYFEVKGRIDSMAAPTLERKLEQLLRAGRINIVLDMGQVEYLSSTGIRALLSTYKKARKQGGELRISNPSECVKNVLGMTALDELLIT